MIKTLMVDLDGTLALNNTGRAWYGEGYEKRVYEDDVNHMVNKVIGSLYGDGTVDRVMFMSGRMEIGRAETTRWLRDKAGWWANPSNLIMRANGDKREDVIVKRELWEQHIKGKYDVLLALDDRPSIVALWRSLNIPTWQVGEYR
jgi:hypothetical protein